MRLKVLSKCSIRLNIANVGGQRKCLDTLTNVCWHTELPPEVLLVTVRACMALRMGCFCVLSVQGLTRIFTRSGRITRFHHSRQWDILNYLNICCHLSNMTRKCNHPIMINCECAVFFFFSEYMSLGQQHPSTCPVKHALRTYKQIKSISVKWKKNAHSGPEI